MPESQTLAMTIYDLVMALINRDPETVAAFEADPQGFLAAAGLSDMCLAEINDALPLILDRAPAEVAARFDDDRAAAASSAAVVSDQHAPVGQQYIAAPVWHGGGGHDGGHHGGGHGGGHHDGGHGGGGHGGGHGGAEIDKVVAQLQYVTNNYSYETNDSHDTIFNTAIEQNIRAEGDVTSAIEISPSVASGDGAVSVGNDLLAPVATGDNSAAGEGNMVNGDGGAAFGAGDVSTVGGSIDASNGAAVSLTETATGESSSAIGFGEGDTTSGSGTATLTPDNSVTDSSTDLDTTTISVTDSSTTTETDSSDNSVTETDSSTDSVTETLTETTTETDSSVDTQTTTEAA